MRNNLFISKMMLRSKIATKFKTNISQRTSKDRGILFVIILKKINDFSPYPLQLGVDTNYLALSKKAISNFKFFYLRFSFSFIRKFLLIGKINLFHLLAVFDNIFYKSFSN